MAYVMVSITDTYSMCDTDLMFAAFLYMIEFLVFLRLVHAP